MIYTISYNSHANIAASPINDPPSIPEQIEPIPLEAIIPLIEEDWKDEERAYGELYDKMYSTLSARAANLRRQLQRCSDSWRYQQIEKDLADLEVELCEILLKFEELTPYPD